VKESGLLSPPKSNKAHHSKIRPVYAIRKGCSEISSSRAFQNVPLDYP
jgi:hypothetical protein